MPPANSRNTSPPMVSVADPAGTGATTPPSYLSALQELESPVNQDVLNLANTLTTQAEDNVNEASLRYLRASQEHEEWRVERSRERLRLLAHQRDELDHRERLRRVMSRLSSINDLQAAYGDRVPSQNSLYDWSPATNDDDEEELDQILAEIRRDQPNTHPEIIRVLARSQLDTEREARVRASHSSRLPHSSQPSQPPDSSLRSAAILQSARRHARFSARTRDRDHLPRSDRDRDSPSRQADARDRFHNATENVRQATMQRLSERRTSLDRERDHDMLARVDSYRRSYLDRSSTAPPPISPMLEQTIKYLAKIRYCQNVDDSLNCALDAGFLNKDYFCDEQSDFVLDTFTLPPPTETSWLAPGAVLSGYQHATTVNSNISSSTPGTNTTLYRFRNDETMTSTLFEPPSRPWLSHSYNPPHRRSAAPPPIPEPSPSQTPQQDRWPVKVTIHAVDYSKMSLSATMEAYNVPSHPHSHQSVLSSSIAGTESPSARTSSITTYLEGEILDFNTHTLLTESFKSTPGNDATYWRKLPPFQKFNDEELVRRLTSRKWFEEVLGKEWVLMRWKERCFVKSLNRSTADPVQPHTRTSSFQDLSVRPTPSMRGGTGQPSFHSSTTSSSMMNSSLENRPYNTTSTSNYHYFPSSSHNTTEQGNNSSDDSGCGLTISGFYYVCLRRSDGKLEGLYYDPQSSPYQCLKLESVRGGVFPAWGFR